jgi:protease I
MLLGRATATEVGSIGDHHDKDSGFELRMVPSTLKALEKGPRSGWDAIPSKLMNKTLLNKRIAVLAADGFEQVELEGPMEALKTASAEVRIISPKAGQITGMNHTDKGSPVDVDLTLEEAAAADFDGLVIPGGLYNPDTLRSTPAAVEFTKQFAEAGKPIAAICHGPWVLIEAGVADGRRMTSWPAIRTDVENAGGEWVDEEVVVDNGIVTSRKPDDIPAFNRKMIEEFAEGVHPVAAN